jgi:hypothetical protein
LPPGHRDVTPPYRGPVRIPAPPLPQWGHRKSGRQPLEDPADARGARFGMRLHPDLRHELELIAREDGVKLSQTCEKTLIDFVNRRRARDVLDRIGRYRIG